MTDLSKTHLTTILSALDGDRRSPANNDAALKAIGRSAERLGPTSDAVLAATVGLLDGQLNAERGGRSSPSRLHRRRASRPTPMTRPSRAGRGRTKTPRRRC